VVSARAHVLSARRAGGARASTRVGRRSTPRELVIVAVASGWIGSALLLDAGAGIWRQRLLGLVTWIGLLVLLRRESRSVRAQVAVVVAYATLIEYSASPLLGLYTYRLHNVPAFVPPGHGMVYLAALAIGRSPAAERLRRPFLGLALAVCGGWALWGIAISERRDVLGVLLFLCLVRFVLRGRSPLTYAGAFVVTVALELAGTWIGTWQWAATDPTGHLGIGNPPSGIPGAYCFLDQAGMALAPLVLVWVAAAGAALQRLRPALPQPAEARALD
jgi:hypothetical protein